MAKNSEGLTILYDEPLMTNAAVNRQRALEMAKAGMGASAIAREFSAVFSSSRENGREVLGQKYDSIHKASQRKDTRYTITREATKAAIAKWKSSPEGQAESKRRRARVPGRYQVVLSDPADPWNYSKLTLHSAHNSEKAAEKVMKALSSDLGRRAAVLDTIARPDIKIGEAAKHETSGERHERGENPRVSAPLKRRIDRVLGRGKSK